MKKSLFTFLVLAFIIQASTAQPINLSFTASGLGSSLDSIRVQNLTQCTSLLISGSDTLELFSTVDVQSLARSCSGLKTYPNPSKDGTYAEFTASSAGIIGFEIIELSGRLVLKSEIYADAGKHRYFVSGLPKGVFMLKIQQENEALSSLLLSLQDGEKQPNIHDCGTLSSDPLPETNRSCKTMSGMAFNSGEYLLLTGYSGIYIRVLVISPTVDTVLNFAFIDCSDGDNNHYAVVTIGTQTWMAENLRTTRYNNGDPIFYPGADNNGWATDSVGAYAWYGNDSANHALVYGALYDFNALNPAVNGGRNVCPLGWHVPSDGELTTLANFLGGDGVAGGKIKSPCSPLWAAPNTGATNISGFSATPGGMRYNDGNYYSKGVYAYFFSSDPISIWAWCRSATNNAASFNKSNFNQTNGFSVRCVE